MKNNHIKGKTLIKDASNINVLQNVSSNHLLVGTFLLLVGILVGISLNANDTFALEDASSSNATNSNATSSNATNSNATSSNATNSNATSSNASASNASSTDNILYLNSISFSTNSVNPGDKIYINKNTSGACNSAITIYFKEKTTNNTFSVNVESLNDNPYFVVPNNTGVGEYIVTDVVFIGLNSDNTTFTKHYSINATNENISSYDFNLSINVKANEKVSAISLNKLEITSNSVSIGDKVSINISASESLTSLKLDFKSANGNTFTTYVNSLSNNPYFTVPATVKPDNYSIEKATLVSSNTTTIYTNGSNFNFNTNLTIKEASKDTNTSFVYNNEDINDTIIKEIYNSKEDLKITINANGKSIILEELFKAIKGTKKQLIINYGENELIFCGNDIDTPKSIDVSISTSLVNDSEELKELVNDGIVVNFASNGNLPGNATVKVKITDEMKEKFGNKKINVYFYEDTQKGFNTIANEITAENGYYQFNISHNSKYILTTSDIDNKHILDVENNTVSNQKSGLSYLTIGLVVLVVVIGGILLYKNRKEIFKK